MIRADEQGADRMRTDVLGVGFDSFTIEQAVSVAYDEILSGGKSYVVTPNPEIVWQCRKNEALREALSRACLVLPDGIGVIIGARILRTPMDHGRIPGIDFASALFEKMAGSGKSVFLLGAKPGVAEMAGEKLAERYPGLIISGTLDGYFTDDKYVIEKVNEAAPSLLLVCLGAPKQELWMAENIGSLSVPLCAGLGGSLDVFAGNIKRAPVFFRKLGLEWLYRLMREPRRLKRSMCLPLFLLTVIRKRLRTRHP